MRKLLYLFSGILMSVVIFSCSDTEDTSVPEITNLEIKPESPEPNEEVIVSAVIDTPEGAPATVTLTYKVNGGTPQTLPMSNGSDGNVFSATIPGQGEVGVETKVELTVSASNRHGNAIPKNSSYVVPAIAEPIDFSYLILNEISGAELFVEIFNAGDVNIPLEGVVLQRNGPNFEHNHGTPENPDWTRTTEWVGAPGDYIPAGAYRIILFRDGDHPDNAHLVDNPAFVGWTVPGGLSNQQVLKIALIAPDGEYIDLFIRGDESNLLWGTPGASRPANPFRHYARMADGTWAWAAATPGATNAAKHADIVNPGYLTSLP